MTDGIQLINYQYWIWMGAAWAMNILSMLTLIDKHEKYTRIGTRSLIIIISLNVSWMVPSAGII